MKFTKTVVSTSAAMILSMVLAPAAYAGDDPSGNDGQGPAVFCEYSVGERTGDDIFFGGDLPDGDGSSCNSVGIGADGDSA
jgi:hypothetical protein